MTDTKNASTHFVRSVWQRQLIKIAVSILCLWAVAWLAVPPLLKWQLQKQASAQLGRTVSVEAVEFRPWSLELTLRGLKVATAGSEGTQLAIDRVYVDAELQSLFRLAPVLDAVELDRPKLQLRHLGQGSYDIDDILAKLLQPNQASKPTPFAVFNISVTQGELDFADDTVGKTHEIRTLTLNVPFLSNLDSKRDIISKPRLAFELNGSRFDTDAATTPFAQTHRTSANLKIPALDIAPYLPYWPASWPVRPESGQINLDLQLDFEQQDVPHVKVSGQVGAKDFHWLEVRNNQQTGKTPSPLLAWQDLELKIRESRPLERQIELQEIRWNNMALTLQRNASGQLNVQRILQAFRPDTAPKQAASQPSAPWHMALQDFALVNSTINWQDDGTQPRTQLALKDLNLTLKDLQWPGAQPAGIAGSVLLAGAPLKWSGQAHEQATEINFELAQLPLSVAAPYLATVIQPPVNGQLSGQGALHWSAQQKDKPAQLKLDLPAIELQTVAAGRGQDMPATFKRLRAENTSLDMPGQSLVIGKLRLDDPQILAQRNRQGRWAFEDWGKANSQPSSQGTAVAQPQPWKVELADLQISNGQLRLVDESPSRPVKLDISAFNLQTKNLNPTTSQPVAVPLTVSLQMAVPGKRKREAGKLQYQGQWRLPANGQTKATAKNSFLTQGRLTLDKIPVHALEPYFGEQLNLDLIRADTSFRGTLEAGLPPEGLLLNVQGDVAVDDFRASTLSPAEDLLDWKTLNLRGTRLQMASGQLREFTVKETALNDYFARVIVHESGRINLQTLVKPRPAEEVTTAVAPAAPSPSPAVNPKIEFGPIGFVNGRVRFSDRFIQPNYSANLSELTGRLGAFSNQNSDEGQKLAELSLQGKAEGTATLEVNGQLNPLANPMAMNIKGAVRELELPPLSPYTVKYAGYGIDKGKLSMDVSYQIAPNGQLVASNKIILNQLNFGERVEGSNAPNLPIKLAVALLADRNGVIDINLPVSGSINDPQFRIGSIIFKLVLNLIGKAITSPFALIAHALGGGGEELNQIVFAPGSAVLDDTSRERLNSVAKALASRPVLKLTVVGESDLDTERSGYQRTRLNEQVLMEKRRKLAREGVAVDEIQTVDKAEYPDLLKSVYRRADIPKPRNIIGLAKDIPTEEMEKLLQASIPVNANAMRELAVQRGAAVKDYLAQQVPLERLFLGAPVLSKAGEAWQPKAELRLATD